MAPPALLLLVTYSILLIAWPCSSQTLLGTIAVGSQPEALAINTHTSKVYVANQSSNSVTVIDEAAGSTVTLQVGSYPTAVAVNAATNKIYVANQNSNSVTVIDGASNSTAPVAAGSWPRALDINPVTNKIYVANYGGNSVTVINGANNTTSTIAVGNNPIAVAVNSVTNKVYVANLGSNSVTVIDGATGATTTVPVGSYPRAVAVNPLTNKIYVANVTNGTAGTVTVIDGSNNSTTTVPAGVSPNAVAVNLVTNQIYVANEGDGTVTVINGTSHSTTTIPVGSSPGWVSVDPVSNKAYISNYLWNGSVTMIDGASGSTKTLSVGRYPYVLAIDSTMNRIYVANAYSNTVSVIGGASSNPAQFVAVTPCRLYDTRPQYGGSGPIPGGASRTFNLPQLGQAKACTDLSSAAAYSLNVTVVPGSPLGYLIMWPTGEDQPSISTLNSLDGRIKANAAIVPAGAGGSISVYVTNTTDVILDIDGYFAPLSASTLAFYPLPPCRVADTRKSNFPSGLGTPYLSGGVPRDFPVLSSTCDIPTTVQAYSLNFTAVPYPTFGYGLGYLEVWPKDQMPQHPVSTLNNLTGTIVANAAIVPAGTDGEITALASNNTDVVIDINGYFAPAGQGGLSLYPVAPCRVIDTRKVGSGQPFSGALSPPVNVVESLCAPPATAQAYVFNATVVPQGGLGYLTLWPDSSTRPQTVSTLNAIDGWIASNMAIVPTNNGKIDAYVSGITQLILDISSYFAP